MQVEACRARLYALADRNLSLNTPATSQESCDKAILPKVNVHFTIYSDFPNTERQCILTSVAVWDLAVQIIEMFEEVKLKGQTLRLANLIHKPELNYLTPIRTQGEEEKT